MDHGVFPNVTYGNTTTKNAIKICNEIGCETINNYYVTRCYQTRHGNGWMSNEREINLINNHEEINVQNQWQGNFRVGEFDLKLFNHAYLIDKIYNSYINNDNLVVTCVDQRPDLNFNEQYGKIRRQHKTIKNIYESFSPNTQDIRLI
jgi:adenylosuccinate synthase